ncbi:MAG TPA: LuxR C-terminal-related transcriptional regulator [Dehalococcoidia bacterium]|nr:LuxR C-terminal-related transcriptional regulator [Dehalococcoidia bacterium]
MTRSRRPSLLTPREREIAALAASGLTCRQVAERLFLSVYTVRVHLRHAYDKAGVKNRLELEHWLNEQELAEWWQIVRPP